MLTKPGCCKVNHAAWLYVVSHLCGYFEGSGSREQALELWMFVCLSLTQHVGSQRRVELSEIVQIIYSE